MFALGGHGNYSHENRVSYLVGALHEAPETVCFAICKNDSQKSDLYVLIRRFCLAIRGRFVKRPYIMGIYDPTIVFRELFLSKLYAFANLCYTTRIRNIRIFSRFSFPRARTVHIITGRYIIMEYEVIRSKRKTLAVEIRLNKVIVRAPFYASDADIRLFVQNNRSRIETHAAKALEQQKAAEACRKLSADELRELADRALTVIPERVKHYAPLVGVTYGRITIRNQRTKWGSCSSKGNLNFNCLLMLAPPEVLDSVVVHELCHRKEMNHSDRFYAELLRVFPDYWACHKWLKENGAILMAMQN